MAPFYPVYVRRSDGKLDVKGANGKKELNEPLAEQLDSKPNEKGICDFYRECQPGEVKEIDWRRKLGGMLLRELGGPESKDKAYILAALPENYRVYEHVKCKVNEADGKPIKTTKNHAAGGNERQDAYLYGHPGGRRKRYRSPGEFFPHLLWLATDETGDPNNCGCKFCSPEEIEDEKPAPKPKEAKVEAKAEAPLAKDPVVKSETVTGTTNSSAEKKTSQNAQPSSFQPSPLPRLRSQEHKLDSHLDEFYYRLGEVVWFSRGAAWGLAVVVRRELVRNYNPPHQYQVQPLSHPFHYPPMMTCSQDQLRPWLAWSPPPCTNAELDPNRNRSGRSYSFETVDWEGYLNGKYGPGEVEVDASILAARAVETTFTPFERLDSKTSNSGNVQITENQYNGIYIGGERIWLGDALRLRNGAEATDIMVLHSIIEITHPSDPSKPQITLVGDTYSYRITQLEPQSVPQTNNHLPQRLRADLHYRNNVTSQHPDPARRHTSFWKLQSKSTRLSIADIKGRWYESSIFMPLLDPDNFHNLRASGEINDAGLWMNGHGDANREGGQAAPKPADVKAKRREDAFGRSVPPSFRISRGFGDDKDEDASGAKGADGNGAQQTRPDAASQYVAPAARPEGQPQSQYQQQYVPAQGGQGMPFVSLPEGGFEQYMKFDDVEGGGGASLPGFGQEYSSQDLERGYYGQGPMQH